MELIFPPRRIAVIGLGYVGLPLAVAFSRHAQVIGFDIDPKRSRSSAGAWIPPVRSERRTCSSLG